MSVTTDSLRTLTDNLDEYIHIPGGIGRLKKMVLHLAVSGQLVPQNPSEGTGQELFEKIQAEKVELIKQGKIRKPKPLPEITEDEIPFEIPESWRWVRTGDVGYSLGQKKPSSSFYYVDVASIDNSSQTMGELSVVEAKDAPSRARKMVYEDTVIFSTVRPYLLNAAIVSGGYNKELIASTAFAILHPYRRVDSRWILNYLISSHFINYTNEKSVGMAYPAINDKQFQMGIIPLPPLAEQKRIVAKVDAIFVLIDELAERYQAEQAERTKLVRSSLARLANEHKPISSSLALQHLTDIIRTKADAAELRKAILHLAVSGQLVPKNPSEGTGAELYKQIQAEKAELVKQGKIRKSKPLPEITDDEIPFEIPESWKWVRLPDIYNSIAPASKVKTSEVLQSGNIPVVDQGQSYIAGYVNSGEVTTVDSPVVVFGDHTREIKLINFDFIAGADGVKILEPVLVNSDYFYTLIDVFRPQSRGYGRHFKMLNDKIVPLPPLAEQKRIVAKTTQLLDLVDELERCFL